MAALCKFCGSDSVYRCSACNNFGCSNSSCDGCFETSYYSGTCSQCNSFGTMIPVNKNPILSWLSSSSNEEGPSSGDLLTSLCVIVFIILMFFYTWYFQ